MNKERALIIQENIEGIKKSLGTGVVKIKDGHRMANVNPEGEEIFLLLTERQIELKRRKLREQTAALRGEKPKWRREPGGLVRESTR